MTKILQNSENSSADFARKDWLKVNPVSANAGKVSANEITSLKALIAYVAAKTGKSQFRVESGFADHFNIPNITCLSAGEFDNAIRYLVNGY